jgi:hypothetical protein
MKTEAKSPASRMVNAFQQDDDSEEEEEDEVKKKKGFVAFSGTGYSLKQKR